MTVDSQPPTGVPRDGALAVPGDEPDWATKVRGLLNGHKLLERVKEAEALEEAEEQRRLADTKEDRAEEVAMAPQVFCVAAEGGAGVFADPRGTATQSGRLHLGDVVTIVGRKGQWLQIADWEAVTGWVRDPSSGANQDEAMQERLPVLTPAPEVPMDLVHLRARAARTEVLSWCEVGGVRLAAPLPGAGLGGVWADAVYSARWGIEARAETASLGPGSAAAPPGRAWRVFAARDFEEGDTVEACELLRAGRPAACPPSSVLWSRTLCHMKGDRAVLLPLGFGALYRRTMGTPEEANLHPLLEATHSWVSGESRLPRMLLRARHSVKAGEELTTAGDFLGMHGGLDWDGPGSGPAAARGLPLPAPCGAHGGGGALRVAASGVHGRGVFAGRDFARGDVVELCPALVLDGPGLALYADFAMSFDRGGAPPTPSTTRAPLLGTGDWDPLADPGVGMVAEATAEELSAGPHFAAKEPAKKIAAAGMQEPETGWDPLAEPLAETLPGSRVAAGPRGPPAPALPAEWSDPFSDPAGEGAPACRHQRDGAHNGQPTAPVAGVAPVETPAVAATPDYAALAAVPGYAKINDSEICLLPLGLGALYNHARRGEGRNLRWAFAATRSIVVMMATRNIQQGEELFIDYGKEYWNGR